LGRHRVATAPEIQALASRRYQQHFFWIQHA
jgi:hypothetical protein